MVRELNQPKKCHDGSVFALTKAIVSLMFLNEKLITQIIAVYFDFLYGFKYAGFVARVVVSDFPFSGACAAISI